MGDVYNSLKWLHVVAIAIGFGSNITHIFWLIAANRDPVHRVKILQLIKKIDDRLAVPSWILATICGATMWLWQWPTNTSWVIVSLVLTLILSGMGIAFGPFMYKWIGLAEQSPDNPPLMTLARRLTIWWISISVTVFIVLFLMVFKPALW